MAVAVVAVLYMQASSVEESSQAASKADRHTIMISREKRE